MKATQKLWIACLATMMFATSSMALTFDFYDEYVHNQSIDATYPNRDTSFQAVLDFPDGGNAWNYPSGDTFEYDDVQSYITKFEITLKGYNDNSEQNIDFFLNFGSMWLHVAAYNVDEYTPFLLTLDLVNQELRYERTTWGGDVLATEYSTIHNVSMDDFQNLDAFMVGYGCHFTHLSTSVLLEGNIPPVVPVPEPLSVILLLAGLVKLVHWARK